MRHQRQIFIIQLSLGPQSCVLWEPGGSERQPMVAGGRKEAAGLREARPQSQPPGSPVSTGRMQQTPCSVPASLAIPAWWGIYRAGRTSAAADSSLLVRHPLCSS